MRTITQSFLLAILFVMGLGSANVQACHLSSLNVDNVTDLGNGTYQLDLTFSCGAGSDGYTLGANQNTGTFAFFLSGGATVASYPASMNSPQTSALYSGFTVQNDTVLAYSSSTDWWACVNSGCGPIQSVTQSISIITNGLPTSVELLGMEGGGNPAASCMGLIVDPACYQFSAEAGPDATVYDGYAPEACATLTASPANSASNYSYAWSNGATSNSITVCPTTTTTYGVTVTDLTTGCSAADLAVVHVVDVHCGGNGSKVSMCRPNGDNACVRSNKVADKLANGWTLGACSSSKTAESAFAAIDLQSQEMGFTAGPNPFLDQTRIQLSLPIAEEISLEVYHMNGQRVAVLHNGFLESGIHDFDLEGRGLAPGIYLAKALRSSGALHTLRIVRQ